MRMFELEASDPLVFFSAFAGLILLGFLGNLVFSRWRFNDTVLLIGVGLLIGPVLHIIQPDSVAGAIGVIGALALILILFTGGLELKVKDLVSGVAGASVLAFGGFAITTALVAVVVRYSLEVSWLAALVVGAILGGTSSVIVMPTLAQMRCDRRTATTLNLESALTDVMVVVSASTLLSVLVAGGGPAAGGFAQQVITLFSLSLFFGGLAGVLWILAVPRVRDKPFGYMMTLGVAFLVYVFTEWILQSLEVSSGGGALAVLAYGIVLGNSHSMGPRMRQRVGDAFGKGLQRFQGEISFLVRTFFFIYLGILVDLRLLQDTYILAVGVAVMAAMVAARYLAVAMARRRLRLAGDDWILFLMQPRGLAAAVMAADAARRLKAPGLPAGAAADGASADAFVAIAFLVLVLSNLITTFGGLAVGARGMTEGGPRQPAGSKRKAGPAKQPSRPRAAPTKAPPGRLASRPGGKAPARGGGLPQDVSFAGKPLGVQGQRVRDRPRPPPLGDMAALAAVPPPPSRRPR